ncbi:hypothetical protein PENTCL1PPCAC_10616, partial [Pristionchus entomophagus]
TAAEKYFSVGDVLIDFRGLPVFNDGTTLKKFNMTFQTVGEIDVLIERPITLKNRESIAALIKGHLSKHDTPAMSDEVTKIGLLAARYHNMFWRRLTPVPITTKSGAKSPVPSIPDVVTKPDKKVNTPEKKGNKDSKKKGSAESRRKSSAETIDKTVDEGQRKKSKHQQKDSKKGKNAKKTARTKKSQKRTKKGSSFESKTKDRSEETMDVSIDATSYDKETTVGETAAPGRVKIVGAKSFQEITSDVAPETELESVGLRYADDFEDENTQDDEEQKALKRAKRALKPIKKGLFSTMALFTKEKKDKEKEK